MDFLKSCTTNVQVVDDVLKTRFRIYQPQDDGPEGDTGAAHTALRELRQRKVLCACLGGKIWTFGSDDVEIGELLRSLGMVLQEEGIVRDVAESSLGIGGRGLRELFLEAVQGGIGFSLARSQGAVRAGPWTWLSCAGGEGAGWVAVRVYASVAESGALRVATTVEKADVSRLVRDTGSGDMDVMLAPSGSPARIVQEDDEGQMGFVDGSGWREAVTNTLAAEGISIPKGAVWTRMRLVEGDSSPFAWPASLAFTQALPQFGALTTKHDAWQTWFSDVDQEGGYGDLIQQAEDWYNNVPEPQQHPTVPDTSTVGSATNVSVNYLGAELGTSPPFMHRPEQQPVGGIYPTPPDGMMPGLSSQQTNADTVPAKAPPAPPEQANGDMTESNDVDMVDPLEEAPRPKPDRNFSLTSSLEEDGQAMDGNHDELFGEVGDSIDFGEGDNEVGDADFSFFDEPDTEVTQPAEAPAFSEDVLASSTLETEGGPSAPENEQQQIADIRDEANAGDMVSESQAEQLQSAEAPQPDILQDQIHADDDAGSMSVEGEAVLAKPLSPFDIKERLFPPPIPASAKQAEHETDQPGIRRNSTFSPIMFRESISLASQYAINDEMAKPDLQASYSLSSKRRPQRHTEQDGIKMRANESDYETSTSLDDSFDTDSTISDIGEAPPRFPWETRKRRRFDGHDLAEAVNSDGAHETDRGNDNYVSRSDMEDLLASLAHSTIGAAEAHEMLDKRSPSKDAYEIDMTTLLELDGNDLIGISQLIAEQAVTTTGSVAASSGGLDQNMDKPPIPEALSALYNVVLESVEELVQDITICDVVKLALVKEALPLRVNSTPANKGQPQRAPQRADTMASGPDMMFVPPPYVRIQRGDSHWEMLPPALSFWDTLSLAPASGPKNVRAFCVLPSNHDLGSLAKDFLNQLGMMYEGCKLGSHEFKLEENLSSGGTLDALVKVRNGKDDLPSAIKSYVTVCRDFGAKLAQIADGEQSRTLVVYMIDPFETPLGRNILCACFWILYKAYGNALGSKRSGSCSDLVLQILPIQDIAHKDSLVLTDFAHMITMAREVYDRCPPAATLDYTSPLPIVAAPAIELASAPPKRITLHLTPDPPGDLLYDGSALHLAYSQSANRQWISAAWVDSTGRYSSTVSFCVRGTTFANIAEDLWERTKDIMAARQAMWRVFIVTDAKLHESQQQCWRAIVGKPRQQIFSVTLLQASDQSALQVMPPQAIDDTTRDSLLSLAAGFPTPASTPQASSFGVSPDASGQGSGAAAAGYAAPPTPAPSDTATSTNLEAEPDAQLVDSTDESWVALLDQSLLPDNSDGNRSSCLARGALLKRGETAAMTTTSTTNASGARQTGSRNLPILAVDLRWTIQVRPAQVNEGTTKHGEMALREILCMYRNLSLLAKARSPNRSAAAVVPWHLDCAVRSARALNECLF